MLQARIAWSFVIAWSLAIGLGPVRVHTDSGGSTAPQEGSSATFSALGTRFAGSLQPVRTMVGQYRTCLAIAPPDWIIYGERREGDALDMISGDHAAAAGFLIGGKPGNLPIAVNSTPESYIHNSLSASGRVPVSYGEPTRDQFGYTSLPFEIGDPMFSTEPAKGILFFRVWPVPGSPAGFIILMRRAQTAKSLWERHGAQAIAVALSIRCTVQLRPGPDRPSVDEVDNDMESTYNQQLGMEYAHDPDTGENYWVSPATDLLNDGPDGPGYYKGSGNERKKLKPGRSQ